MAEDNYTFGDNEQAGARLLRLAELYEPETRELLLQSSVRGPRLAVDLGCGPGFSTRLVQEVLHPDRTVGLDASERYIAEARRSQTTNVAFEVHDVARVPFPVSSPDVLFCRFLLTHLGSPEQALAGWASIAAPGANLVIHETETLETEHPTLRRYYDLVGQLQQHYGQRLLIGAVLNQCLQSSGWRVVHSQRRVLEKRASDMAGLHVANLRTWRHDAYACRAFDAHEVDELEGSLGRIADGAEDGGIVVNTARQIIARCPRTV
jgi:trans-aconitate 2-methyltransferase